MLLPAQFTVLSVNYGGHKAIDRNTDTFISSTRTSSYASAIQDPALVGVTVALDRAYDDIVAVQVRRAISWGMPRVGKVRMRRYLRRPGAAGGSPSDIACAGGSSNPATCNMVQQPVGLYVMPLSQAQRVLDSLALLFFKNNDSPDVMDTLGTSACPQACLQAHLHC